MITKNDCMAILVKLEDKGLNINEYMRKLIVSKEPPIDVLRFIVDNRGIEANHFYEHIRKNHNEKRSPLYKNIVSEISDLNEVITTLTCFLTQATLFGNKLEDDAKADFFKEVRAEEVARVLHQYFVDGSYAGSLALIKLIKADILVLEYVSGRRELAQ